MCEQSRVCAVYPSQPVSCALWLWAHAFVLVPRPADQVAPSMQRPSPDRLPDSFQRLRTGCRQERDRVFVTAPYRLPRPERIAEKVERLVWKFATPGRVLAVDELRLLRVQSELAGCKSDPQATPQRLGLFGASAMADDVVRVSLERNVRVGPRHPRVESIVQKQVHKARACHPSHNLATLLFGLSVRLPREHSGRNTARDFWARRW